MGKNVAVFVDVANIFYAAKAAGVDIDYVTLLKSAIAGRDFVRAYAYTGLDPDNENQRNFHDFLRRHDYKVVSKDIRKYGDGKIKANLDIELVVDMMKTARNLDVAIVVSGDGDFAPAIRAVQEMGVRVEVVSFRGNTSSDLMDVADQFTDIIQIARVEKGTSRSGRRVADDDQDLSMTEVPDKLTEGSGGGRGRGLGRGRSRARSGEPEREPLSASAGRLPARGTRARRVEEEPAGAPTAVAAPAGSPIVGLIALPGEKLSKTAQARLDAVTAAAPPAVEPAGDDAPQGGYQPADGDGEGDEAQRRRRRRGGRGRGRGRGRGEGGTVDGLPADADVDKGSPEAQAPIEQPRLARPAPQRAPAAAARLDPDESEEEAIAASQPRAPKSAAFGSFWDSQIGQTRPPAADLGSLASVDEDDEPAIPEYLIAEQRRGGSAGRGVAPGRSGGGAARGGRAGSYAAAVDRERYGRGAGGGGGISGGINRYPDVSGRGSGTSSSPTTGRSGGGRSAQPIRPDERRDDRAPVRGRAPERPNVGHSDEPWSEVPPELEAVLRAQLASKSSSRPEAAPTPTNAPAAARPARAGAEGAEAPAVAPGAVPVEPSSSAGAAPKRRAPSRAKPAGGAGDFAAATPSPLAAPTAVPAAGTAPKRRVTTRATSPSAAAATPMRGDVVTTGPADNAPAPARRTATRAKATPAGTATPGGIPAAAGTAATAARRPRASAAPAESAADTQEAAPKPRPTARRKAAPTEA